MFSRISLILTLFVVSYGCAATQRAVIVPEPVIDEAVVHEPEVHVEYKFPTPKIPKGYTSKTFLSPEGEKVTLLFRKDSIAEGLPTNGRLINGVKLPPKGIGYIHLSSASFGTDELIKILQYCLKRVVERYQGTADVVIGALSKEGGGKLKPHKSHRNGLDVDIGYYHKDNVQLKHFVSMTRENLDVEKTYFLIESLISTGAVEYIFMNYSLQALFYEHAKNLGYSEDALEELFQYPSGKKTKKGIIRHANGHDKHFHVRIYSLDRKETEDVE